MRLIGKWASISVGNFEPLDDHLEVVGEPGGNRGCRVCGVEPTECDVNLHDDVFSYPVHFSKGYRVYFMIKRGLAVFYLVLDLEVMREGVRTVLGARRRGNRAAAGTGRSGGQRGGVGIDQRRARVSWVAGRRGNRAAAGTGQLGSG